MSMAGRWRWLSALLVVAGCAGTPARMPGDVPATDEARTAVIAVVRRGWHVSVAFPVAALDGRLATLVARDGAFGYLDFGFGDRRYLTNPATASFGLLAAAWPGEGLLLVTPLAEPRVATPGAAVVVTIAVTPAQRDRALGFVGRSFATVSGAIEPIGAGSLPDSTFYAASRRYSAAYTCNTWAAGVLAAAGLPVDSHGVVFAGQLWRQVRRLAARPASPVAATPQ